VSRGAQSEMADSQVAGLGELRYRGLLEAVGNKSGTLVAFIPGFGVD
jgi:hypothetical protein